MAAYERIIRRLIMTGLCRPMIHEIPGSVRGVTSLPVAALPASPLLRSPGLRADAALQRASPMADGDASDAPPGAMVGQGSLRYRD
jgi:hypothetical protein